MYNLLLLKVNTFSEQQLFHVFEFCAKALGASEEEIFEFTRCVRPDGTYYGTRGSCKKGVKASKKGQEDKPVKKVRGLGDDRPSLKVLTKFYNYDPYASHMHNAFIREYQKGFKPQEAFERAVMKETRFGPRPNLTKDMERVVKGVKQKHGVDIQSVPFEKLKKFWELP